MELDLEIETFERELPLLLRDHGLEFVLIHGDRIDSFWKTEDEGYEAGCERFGLDPFLVKKVQEKEVPLAIISHATMPCPPSPGPSRNG